MFKKLWKLVLSQLSFNQILFLRNWQHYPDTRGMLLPSVHSFSNEIDNLSVNDTGWLSINSVELGWINEGQCCNCCKITNTIMFVPQGSPYTVELCASCLNKVAGIVKKSSKQTILSLWWGQYTYWRKNRKMEELMSEVMTEINNVLSEKN